jgi:hypothetical protein
LASYFFQCFGFGFIESGSGSIISSESGSGSRVLMTKMKKNTPENLFSLFFLSKIAIHLIKNVPAAGEAFSPQKKTSSTSKDEIY